MHVHIVSTPLIEARFSTLQTDWGGEFYPLAPFLVISPYLDLTILIHWIPSLMNVFSWVILLLIRATSVFPLFKRCLSQRMSYLMSLNTPI